MMRIFFFSIFVCAFFLEGTPSAGQSDDTPIFSEPRFDNTGEMIALRHCNKAPCGIVVINRSGRIINTIVNNTDFDWQLPIISNYKEGFFVSAFRKRDGSTNLAWIDPRGEEMEVLTQQDRLHYLLADQSKNGRYLLYLAAHPKTSGRATAKDFQVCEFDLEGNLSKTKCVPNFSIDLADRPSYLDKGRFLISGFEIEFRYRSDSDKPELIEEEPVYYLDRNGNVELIDTDLRFPSDPTAIDNGQFYISGLSATRQDSSFGYDVFLWKDGAKTRVTYLETFIRSFDVSADGRWLVISAWDAEESSNLLYLVDLRGNKVESIVIK